MSAVPDLVQAERFLALLDEAAEVWRFRTFPETRGTGRNRPGALSDVADALRVDNGNGRGAYVVVNDGGNDDKSITRVRAVFADFDPPDTSAMPAPDRFPLEPHIIVESSRGKHHVYWLVDGLAVDEFEATQRAIAAKFGSDPKVCNPSRVMRLPGFIHRKPADAGHDGQPFQTRIIAESGAVPYTADAIRAAFSSKPDDGNDDKPGSAPGSEPEGKLSDGRRDDLYKAGCDYRDGGARGAKLLRLLRGYNLANFDPPKPDDEVAETARNVERYARNRGIQKAPPVGNAEALLQQKFQPVQWAVRGILPEGITILSGDPKIGKSWFLYQASVAIAAGKPMWPGRDPEAQGEALMLALEDNDRRLQRRLNTLLPYFAAMKGTRFVQPDVSGLHYATEWPRADAGVEHLREWLVAHPRCRLVVIDTVGAFREKDLARNKSAYAADYEVGEMFKPLAREFSCAIVLVMHNRKQHSADALQLVSGTQGMTGGVDNVLVLRRERGQLDAGLYVDGRDIEEPQEIALRFKDGYWTGDGRTVDEARMSKERRQVIDAVTGLGDKAKVRAIAAELFPAKEGTVRSRLSKMVRAGELVLTDGVYSLPGTVETAGTKEAA